MIAHFTMARIALPFGIAALGALDARRRTTSPTRSLAAWALAAVALGAIAALAWVCTNHVGAPLHLETMESVVLQHVVRVTHGLPLYPRPSPAYVPLAYNPGYYFLAAPFTWVMGPTLGTLRIVAILGVIGSAITIAAAVRRLTGSSWWALIAVGLFAAAYRAMDSALDNAHADSWLLCAALVGTETLDRAKTWKGRVAGVLVLILAFWFKQPGALFVVGGLAFLTWRLGVRRSLLYWVIAALTGGIAYLAAVTWPFGPYFHYFTWVVPSSWSTVSLASAGRVALLAMTAYPVLMSGAVLEGVWALRQPRGRLTAWHIQWGVGVLSALMAALDWSCSDNVFIPFGAFTIALGCVGWWRVAATRAAPIARTLPPLAVALSFALLLYDPRDIMVPPDARPAYADLMRTIEGLDGPVFVPSIGQNAGPPTLSPAVVWVAIADIVRGHHRTAADWAFVWESLEPATHPTTAQAYILTNSPLNRVPGPVKLLAPCYTLDRDFDHRFAALLTLVKHFKPDWPRYLYRYHQSVTSSGNECGSVS